MSQKSEKNQTFCEGPKPFLNMIGHVMCYFQPFFTYYNVHPTSDTAGQSPDFALFQWGNRTFENSRKPNKYSRLSYIKICNCNTYMGMIYAKGRSSNVNFFFFCFFANFFLSTFFFALVRVVDIGTHQSGPSR